MTDGDNVRVPDALIKLIAANDVAAEVARIAIGEPINGFENVGGPDKCPSPMLRVVAKRPGDDLGPLSSMRRRPTSAPGWAQQPGHPD